MTNSESLSRGVCMWETFIYTALISLGLLTQAAGMQRRMCVCQPSQLGGEVIEV